MMRRITLAMVVRNRTSGLVPRPVQGIELSEMEGEGILYWHEKATMLYLNESARVIWQLCDGARTVSEIVRALEAEFPEVANEVSLQVPETIEQFAAEGVLELAAK
jgi:hypothetical protein